MTKTQAAFVQGFMDGRKSSRNFTARKVLGRFPAFDTEQVNCYLNGHDDAIKGDAYRYNLVRNELHGDRNILRASTLESSPALLPYLAGNCCPSCGFADDNSHIHGSGQCSDPWHEGRN